MMTTLAAVETYQYLQHSDGAGGLILPDFFTALVPVRVHESGVIQWHFESSETDIIRPVDPGINAEAVGIDQRAIRTVQ